MYSIGQQIKIKYPFNLDDKFIGIFTIKQINLQNTYVILNQTQYAFDFKYIEEVI